MSIRIRTISLEAFAHAKKKRRFEPGQVTLFFGKNESGKSILVRSILGSVFKVNKTNRPTNTDTIVEIEGLSQDTVRFTSKSKQSIEQILSVGKELLLQDLSRLCVVSEGNLSLDNKERNNITVETLRGYFSDQNIRNKVLGRINLVVKNGSLTSDGPIGKNQGEFLALRELEEQLAQIEAYVENLNENYTEAKLSSLFSNVERIKDRLAQINKAKIATAWQIKQEIEKLRQFSEGSPIRNVIEAINVIKLIHESEEKAKALKLEVENYGNLEDDLAWCDGAINFLSTQKSPASLSNMRLFLLFFSSAIFISLLVAVYLDQLFWAGFSGTLLFISFLLFAWMNQADQTQKFHQQEIRKTFAEFTRRFDRKDPSLVDLKQVRDRLSQNKGKLEGLESRYQEEIVRLKQNWDELREQCSLIGIPFTKQIDLLEKKLQEREQSLKDSQKRQELLTNTLMGLGLKEEEIYEITVNSTYSHEEEIDQTESLNIHQQEINSLEANNAVLLQKGRSILGIKSSDYAFLEVLDEIGQKRERLIQEIRQHKAAIMAGILVNNYFLNLTAREDETINRILQQSQISQFLKMFTEHYSSIAFDENEVIVRPDDIKLSELSTGTQEQVLLAIRFGILRHYLTQQSMFIILDDAFQHSDWDRRLKLVDSLGTLASEGWQILYFTMDEHVRSLFESRLKPRFKDQFKLYDLDRLD